MKIKVLVSARHVHLTKGDYDLLFKDTEFIPEKQLTQPGEFASNLFVKVVTPKNIIEKVRVVGPLRNYTQLEISKTDAYNLGINPPVRSSGDLKDASLVKLIGITGSIEKECAIIANRHIHINKEEIKKYRLGNIEKVKLVVPGIKGGILDNVYLKKDDNYVFEAHIDVDDANSHLINSGDFLEIIN